MATSATGARSSSAHYDGTYSLEFLRGASAEYLAFSALLYPIVE